MSSREYEFGDFRVNPQRYELTRAGHRVRLEKIPFDLLVLLLERREELLSREDITKVLWGTSPLQDLDQSLNTAIRKIRVALRDSAEDPHFLQTVVGRGYRFIAPVKVIEPESGTGPATPEAPRVALASPGMWYRWRLILAAISPPCDVTLEQRDERISDPTPRLVSWCWSRWLFSCRRP